MADGQDVPNIIGVSFVCLICLVCLLGITEWLIPPRDEFKSLM
jgi:hypothetical protein